MAEKQDRIDVGQLAGQELSESAFPGGGKKAFRIFFDRKVHERITAHAAEKKSLEVCGVLVGRWLRDADGPFAMISEAIRCDKAASNAGDVTFTHEAWNDIHHEMDTRLTEFQIVGWYHSHPTYGIFLSDRDRFIHEHFFSGPGQVAHVVDPVLEIEGVFVWRNGKLKLCPHFWVGEEIHLSSEGVSQKLSSPSPGVQPAVPPKPESTPLISQGMLWTVTVFCLVLLAYYIGSGKTAWEQRMVVEGVVAHYGLWKGLQPGLRERLNIVDENLEKITQFVEARAKEHIAAAGDAAEEKKAQWAMAMDALQQTHRDVHAINQQYGLSPEESAAVERMILAKQAELEAMRIQHEEAAEKSVADGPTAEKAAGEKPSEEKPAKEGAKTEQPATAPKAGGQAVEAKPGQAKPAEAKPGKAKPMEAKPVKTKPAAPDSATKHIETPSPETKKVS